MEDKTELRWLIRQTLNEASDRFYSIAKQLKCNEPENSKDSLANIDENILDDKKLHGTDKIMSKVNDKLK